VVMASKRERPARPADERVVVPLLVRRRRVAAFDTLWTRYRTSAVTARERPSRRPSRAARPLPPPPPEVPTLLLSGHRRAGRECSSGSPALSRSVLGSSQALTPRSASHSS